jgi:septum formation protein
MESIKYNLVLGSGSPRRKELLGHTGLFFQQITADIEEHSNKEDPCEVVIDIATQKAEEFFNHKSLPTNPLIITSDTIVVHHKKILGKPTSKENAREILSQLSGSSHLVYTAVSFHRKVDHRWLSHSFFAESEVTFAKISEDLMNLYLSSDECMDKAGAYGIQGKGLIFVDSVKGSYSNVVGFPLSEVIRELKTFLEVSENTDLSDYFYGP